MARQKYSKSSLRKYASRKRPAWIPGAGYGPKTTAAIASATNNLNARLRNVESNIRAEETKKYYAQQNETQLVAQSPTLTMLNVINGINQGDSAYNLDGISYSLRGIAMKFLVHNTTGVTAIARIAIIRCKSGQTLSTQGEDLLTGSAQNGLDFSSATEYQRYYCPLNRKKYDVIMERTFKIGAKNSVGTSNYDCNQLIRGYKRYKNRKEYMNSNGDPDTKYYILGWCVDTNMDNSAITLEVTGETTFYYKDN